MYIYAFVAATFKIIPLVSTSLLGILAFFQMYFSAMSSFFYSFLVCAIYTIVDSKLSNDIFERELPSVNPFLLGMSAFMGLYAFDLSGILYGPLLLCMGKISYDLLSKITWNERNELELIQNNK